MPSTLLLVRLALAELRFRRGEPPFDDRGEGVISTAIAVLIMAFLGAAMWLGFNAIWGDAETNIGDQVDQIGR